MWISKQQSAALRASDCCGSSRLRLCSEPQGLNTVNSSTAVDAITVERGLRFSAQ